MTEVMAAEIEKLIERLEKATGPDRELDAEIAATLRIYRGQHKWAAEWSGEWRAAKGLVHLMGEFGSRGNFRPPAFTESIDAAASLGPDESGFSIDTLGKGNGWGLGDTKPRAVRNQSEDQWTYHGWEGASGATPAIALCIASLKAIAALRALSHKGSSND